MTTAYSALPANDLTAMPRPEPQRWMGDVWRALVFLPLFSLIFLPEFSRDGADSASTVYGKALAGFRFVDIAIAALILCHIVLLGCVRNRHIDFPRRLVLPGLAFLGCIAIAMLYGSARGGSNFFFDWRGVALGMGLYLVWCFWMQTAADVSSAIRLFAGYMTLRIAFLYALYLAGYRDTLLGVSIPIFDGPALSCIVFTALLAFASRDVACAAVARLLWFVLAAGGYLIVLLCFRRTYWAELGIGTMILLARRKRHRLRNLAFLAATLGVAAAILGSSFSGRLASLDLANADSEFSADNADHLLDLVDAWDQVRQSPVMGIGLGTSYSTWHIRNWKPESVMVHNAPLHVWLKYGIAGLIFYLWFHIALLRWLWRRSKAPRRNGALVSAAFAYLTAQFLVTLTFAPWPYSELQLTTLLAFILAATVMPGRPELSLAYDYANTFRHHARP